MKYRKISPCIWNDAKVRELSDKGKLALLFLLTHPHMTPLGAIRANAPGLACELGWSEKVFRKAFGEVLALGIAPVQHRHGIFLAEGIDPSVKDDLALGGEAVDLLIVVEVPGLARKGRGDHHGILRLVRQHQMGLQGLAGIPAEGGHAGAHG